LELGRWWLREQMCSLYKRLKFCRALV